MTCPDCGTDNRDSAERCSSCGHALALPVGTVLAERYEIKSLLGVGGLGRVYRAHDRMLDEVVAVKVLHPEAARSAELSRRFRSEIKLARKVRHKNVCAIHEYGEHEGYRFVAMELVDGVDLHRILRERGPLPPQDAFDVAIQVSKGLSAIHEAGVIHRDLKTPNIMRDSHGDVRLLDFGIAKLLTPTGTLAVTAVQKVVGTPEYMSPEQIRGDELDERSDLYGLGVVIYELFTGVVPFQGKSPLDTLVKHMNTPPPLYGDAAARLPPGLVAVLRRCLAKRPDERYSTARDLLDALRVARNATFPERAVTPAGMTPLEHAPQPEMRTTVLPRGGSASPGGGPSPPSAAPPSISPPPRITPRPVAVPPAPHAPAPPPARVTPRPVSLPPPVTGAGAPPEGPPRNPQPVAPPVRSARVAAADSALERSETYIELPQNPAAALAPTSLAPPLPAPPSPSKRSGGGGLGAGLALLGLSAAVGAWLWQRYGSAPQEPAPPPTTVAATTPTQPTPTTATEGRTAPTPSPLPASPPAAATPEPAPLPSPTPVSVAIPTPSPTPPAALVSGATPAPSPTPTRAPRRVRATPSPSPTPEPTPTPVPIPTTGSLDLDSKPAAEIEIDGRPAGRSPLSGVPLDAGSRVLKITHPDYWPLTRRVAVEAGRGVRLDVDLSWEAVPKARSREEPFSVPLDDSPSDPYFDRGLRQMSGGDFREAIL
ncbi:MAG TPA: protein kinase, partial [Candidatus Thermoplasmatota archaeon]